MAAGQNTSDLTATAVNLNAATIKDGAGNAANLRWRGDQPGRHPADRHHGADGARSLTEYAVERRLSMPARS